MPTASDFPSNLIPLYDIKQDQPSSRVTSYFSSSNYPKPEILSSLICLNHLLDFTTPGPWLLVRRLLLTWTVLRLPHIRISLTVSGSLLRNPLYSGSVGDYRPTKQQSSLLIQYDYFNSSELITTFLNSPSNSFISKLSRSILLTFFLLSTSLSLAGPNWS